MDNTKVEATEDEAVAANTEALEATTAGGEEGEDTTITTEETNIMEEEAAGEATTVGETATGVVAVEEATATTLPMVTVDDEARELRLLRCKCLCWL